MEQLRPYRERIDRLDDEIVRLLAERFQVVREVAAVKARDGIPVRLADRIEAVCARNAAHGADLGAEADALRQIYETIVAQSCALEDRLIGHSEDAKTG